MHYSLHVMDLGYAVPNRVRIYELIIRITTAIWSCIKSSAALLFLLDRFPFHPYKHPHPSTEDFGDLETKNDHASVRLVVQVTREFDGPRHSENQIQEYSQWVH